MSEDYTRKMDAVLHQLVEEDQIYFKKMVTYVGASSYFYNEEAIGEYLYNLVCDLKKAETDGLYAEDYFGKDPRAMVDQMLSETPKRRMTSYLTLFLVLWFLLAGARYLIDFVWKMPLTIEPLSYLFELFLFLLISQLLMWVWAKYVYGDLKKAWAWSTTILCFGLAPSLYRMFSSMMGRHVALELADFSATLLALLVGLAFLVVALVIKDRLALSLLVLAGSFLVAGILIRYSQQDLHFFASVYLPLIGGVGSLALFRVLKKKGK